MLLRAAASIVLAAGLTAGAMAPTPPAVRDKVALQAVPFPLADVRLLDGPFKQAMQLDQPSTCSRSIRTGCCTPSASTPACRRRPQPLGGWEAPDVELRGHTIGHYLSALALMYAATGDARFKTAGRHMVAELATMPGARRRRGFTTATCRRFPRSSSIASRRGSACGRRTTRCTRSWPACSTCISCAATRRRSTCVTKMADWVRFRVDRLTEDAAAGVARHRVRRHERGARQHLRGDRQRRATCAPRMRSITKRSSIRSPRSEDPLNGLHANTQIPQDHRRRARVRAHRRRALPRHRDVLLGPRRAPPLVRHRRQQRRRGVLPRGGVLEAPRRDRTARRATPTTC